MFNCKQNSSYLMSYTMWSKHFIQLHIAFAIFTSLLCITQSTSHVAIKLCENNSTEKEEIALTCSCLSMNETIVIEDLKISSGSKHLKLPANTTWLEVGQCHSVYLSGSTLTSLFNIHTLHLHHVDVVHISSDYFLQYETQLQVLQFSSLGLSPLQDSLNIHAHRLNYILFDKITLDKQLKLLLRTENNQLPEVLAITNSIINRLGEINISARYVKKLVLQNNTIGEVLTSAFVQDSHETLIENNSIDSLSFLSFDSSTHNFTFKGNTIKSLAIQSVVINNATKITILNNTFYHIERYGFASLYLSHKQGHFVFSGNQLYKQEEGSLIFYFTVFNDMLEIKNNVLHSVTCNCSTLMLLKKMTVDSAIRQTIAMYKQFEKSTFCSDIKNRPIRLQAICGKYSNREWELVILFIMIAGVTVGVISIMISRKAKRNAPYEILRTEETDIT